MQAYFDAFSGISGDMTVGALLDLGVPFDGLQTAIDGLGLPDLRIAVERRTVGGVAATKFVVTTTEAPAERRFAAIRAILDQAPLAEAVRARALATFRVLAEAEGRIHGVAADDVHFHEVGSADAIADVVGAAFGIEALGITGFYVSALPLGRGVVASRHGALPIPAPATVELLRDFAVRHGDGEGEMVTPTGAAILRGLGAVSAPPPPVRLVRVGYGAGTRQLADRPNVLRILLGEALLPAALATDEMVVVECNIDDMNPELYEHAMARLFEAGAVDVTLTPVHMKKGRPGVILQVLVAPERRDAVTAVLFAETTTIGIRAHGVTRWKVARRSAEVATPYGTIVVQIAGGDATPELVTPEYESCRAAATRNDVPLRIVYEAARAATRRS
ncbi:MAG: nickel pincer cofactor biosynthesis protein LarC [Candidatus Binatia bacterium]